MRHNRWMDGHIVLVLVLYREVLQTAYSTGQGHKIKVMRSIYCYPSACVIGLIIQEGNDVQSSDINIIHRLYVANLF